MGVGKVAWGSGIYFNTVTHILIHNVGVSLIQTKGVGGEGIIKARLPTEITACVKAQVRE